MSLFIGNLSAHTRGDDLKHVFRNFGPCTLRLKDRYGFVVYDFAEDAEKALRALQGRNICGESLTLTWSNNQPKPLQRHPREMRSYEMQHGRNFSRGGDYGRKRSSNAWRDHRLDYEQPDVDNGSLNSVDMLDEDRGHHGEDIKDYDREYHDFRDLPVDNDSVVPKMVDTGRWGEQDPSNANGVDDGVEFDRYERYQGHDRKDVDENRQMAYFGDGSDPRSSQEKVRNDWKLRNTCFSCGAEGHKIRNCPRKYSSARKFTRFNHRQDDVINGRKKRSRLEGESPKRHSGKRARRSVSSSPHSDNHASRSRSRSISQYPKSVSSSSSQSRSRPVSRGAHSPSSNSRSSSKSKGSRSRSRSSSSNKAHVNLKASVYKANAPKSKEILAEHRQPVEGDGIENADHENTVVVKSNHAVSGFEVEDDMKDDQPLQRNDDDDNHTTSRSAYEVTNPCTPLPEIGAHAAGSLSPEGFKDTLDFQNSGPLVKEQMPPQTKEPASDPPANYCTGCSTCMSSDEVCRVLKHYGLELPGETEQHVPVEGYFGSARLWPWEIIYYRRLKKGLISVENYARRIAQNQEFGIVDKYIRSSSGWGEIDQENP